MTSRAPASFRSNIRNVGPRSRTAARLVLSLARDPRQLRYLSRTVQLRHKSPLQVRLPWLAFDVIDWLEEVSSPSWTVFEYGGGGSTAFFADRVGQVITVEHDAEWTQALQHAFASTPQVRVVAETSAESYRSYVERILAFPESHFDLVVVDGRERVRCLENSRGRVKPGGYLMLDDSERERYSSARSLLVGWEMIEFNGLAPFKYGFGHTTVWRRPRDIGTPPT